MSADDKELLIRMDERQKQMAEQVKKILEQVTKTNGRVTILEAWKNSISGGWKASQFIVSIVSALAGSGIGVIITHFFS